MGPLLPKGTRRGFVGPLSFADTVAGVGNQDAYRAWLRENRPNEQGGFAMGSVGVPPSKRARTEPMVEVSQAVYNQIQAERTDGGISMAIEDAY